MSLKNLDASPIWHTDQKTGSVVPWVLSTLRLGLIGSPLLLATSLAAQTIAPPDIRPPAPPVPPPPSPLPAPTNPFPVTPTPTPPEMPSGFTGTITVQRFEVVGSTVFSPAEIDAVTKGFLNTPLTFEQLGQAAQAITDLYIQRGYLTSGAYIPREQPPIQRDGGVVRVRVVEGRVTEIRVRGNRRLNAGYVSSRLAIATDPPLNQPRLIGALRLLQLNPLIDRISAELAAGIQPGTNILEVTIDEADTFNTLLSTDNNRSASVGTWQRRVQLSEANLLGLGDGLTLAATNTNGSNTVDASYLLPLSPRNTSLSLNFGTTFSQVIEEPFDELDIRSRSSYYEVSLRHPLIQTASDTSYQELAVGVTGSRLESDTSLLDTPFPLSAGADEEGRSRITAVRWFQEYLYRDRRSVLSLRSQFSLGLNALGATINASPPDGQFFHWQGQARWFRRLPGDLGLLVRVDAQLADRSLPSLEQFGMGGLDTVRGYRRDVLVTDSGVLGSVELQIPLVRLANGQGGLQLIPFLDGGAVWNRADNTTPDPNRLAAVGLGLQWQSSNLTARFDWGIPLVDLPSDQNTLQDKGLYFSLRYSPF